MLAHGSRLNDCRFVEADLRLCFRLCRLLVFPRGGSNIMDRLTMFAKMSNLHVPLSKMNSLEHACIGVTSY